MKKWEWHREKDKILTPVSMLHRFRKSELIVGIALKIIHYTGYSATYSLNKTPTSINYK